MPMDGSGFRSKRPHSEVDDCDECLPISKRINRLHIKGQRNSQTQNDERQPGACQEHDLNSHGLNNSQLLTQWQNGMVQYPSSYSSPDISNGPLSAAVQNGVQQYSEMTSSSMYQPVHAMSQNSPSLPLLPSSVLQNGLLHQSFQSQQQVSQNNPQLTNLNPQFQQQPQDFSFAEAGMSMDYDPELTEVENPHYFHINQVLFKAHCQRMRREGYPVDPDAEGFS